MNITLFNSNIRQTNKQTKKKSTRVTLILSSDCPQQKLQEETEKKKFCIQ